LKGSGDEDTEFDLRADVFKNGALVGSGQLNGVSGGGPGVGNAILRSIGLAFSASNVTLVTADTLSIKLAVRISATGNQATARLWFNDSKVDSRFDAPINGVNMNFYRNTGLTAGKKYYYRVYAVNAAGRSAYSNVASLILT